LFTSSQKQFTIEPRARRPVSRTEGKQMASFNLDDYETVHQALVRLYKDFPAARVLTDNTTPDGVLDRYEFKAELYLDRDDVRPVATGWAYEVIGSSNVNRTSAMENCETSAIGRAISNSVLVLTKPNNNRPSREEMEKVQRMSAKPTHTPEQEQLAIEAFGQVSDIANIEELKNFYAGAQQAGLLHINIDGKTLSALISARKKELEA
jgi:hypothetical protein